MKPLFYSRDPGRRLSVAQSFADNHATTIHMHPRRAALPLRGRGVFSFAYEDIGKTDVWLSINGLVSEDAGLLFQDPARYPNPLTEKSRMLRRLSMLFPRERKQVVDLVPFTEGIANLYTVVSYVDRGILGYTHSYAWRENYEEVGPDGVVRRAHDVATVAPKLLSAVESDYSRLSGRTRVAAFSETAEELDAYRTRRAELFGSETNPSKIVTRLADTAHAFESRTVAALEALRGLPPEAVAVCNLQSYAARLQARARAVGLPHKVVSYARPGEGAIPGLLLMEAPIVDSYRRLDLEARVAPGGEVVHVLGTTGVDRHLHGETQREITEIDSLLEALHVLS